MSDKNFLSDHTATICPKVMSAFVEANRGQAIGFGKDPWTLKLDSVLGELFETELNAFPVVTGSAANSLALATLCPSHGVVFCQDQAHVETQEGGAPEFFTGGAKLALVPGKDGKMDPGALKQKIGSFAYGIHSMKPHVVSLTQVTEIGTAYTLDEIKALADVAHEAGLTVHMDGARLANAVVGLDTTWADVTWKAGVDVLSFSSTKNGTMCGEAVVFFNKDLIGDFEIKRKRGGHFVSKLRYISAQILGYVESGVWRQNAERTNRLARKIADVASPLLIAPVEANQLFMALPGDLPKLLNERGFLYIPFSHQGNAMGRFVISWDQPESDVNELVQLLHYALQSQTA